MIFSRHRNSLSLYFLLLPMLLWLLACGAGEKGLGPNTAHDHQKIWQVAEVPVPAGLTDSNFVSDPDHLLAPSEILVMNTVLSAIYDSTQVLVKVIMLKDIGQADINIFTDDLFRYHQVRKRKEELYLLVAANQKLWAFEGTTEVKKLLPELTCNAMAQTHLSPHLRTKQYSLGIAAQLYVMAERMGVKFPAVEKSAYQQVESPLPPFRRAVNWLVVIYVSTVLLMFQTKRKERTFSHLFYLSYIEQQAKVLTHIGTRQWLIQYVALPLLWTGVLYIPETAALPGKEIIWLWSIGIYVLVMCWIIEQRIRINYQIIERTKDDPGLLYTRFIDAHRGWFWLLVLFPIPLVLYPIWYYRKINQLRALSKPA